MGKKTDAREKFKQADQLFRDKRFPEALTVLDELDKQFPDTKNVIYPRAMCLARVGRYDEALDLCRQLKVEFGDPRGEKLMGKIGDLRKAQLQKEKEKTEPKTTGSPAVPPANVFTLDSNPPPVEDRLKGKNIEFSPVFDPHSAAQGVIPGPESLGAGPEAIDLSDGSPVIDMAALDDLFAAKPAASGPPPIMKPPRSKKGIYIGAGIAAVVLVGLIALPLIRRGGQTQPVAQQAPPAAQQEQAASSTDAQTQPAAPHFDGPEITWLDSIEAASGAADEEGRDILLVFYSSATPSSDMDSMDSYVWSDPTIRYLAKEWICAKIDVEKEPGIRDMYELTRLPTTILTDYAFEEQYYRQEGLIDSHEFYTSMADQGFLAQAETEFELPKLPVIALVMLPILYIVATFLPVLFTLLILGRMPEDDMVTNVLVMLLVGIVSPFFAFAVMRAAYQLERIEVMLYYVLAVVHLVLFFVAMSFLSGFPFHVYLMGLAYKAQGM
ncbi:MAG: hypothetical protein HUU46_00925 [Candidatus Hydrogenedentes bacterium]|nr:hypothetical protein [Candidatus Hydrogenedentota bacterium]